MKDKNCKYCTPNLTDKYGNHTCQFINGLGDSGGMWFYITNGMYLLRTHAIRGFNEIKPKYCPMCGKILNQ